MRPEPVQGFDRESAGYIRFGKTTECAEDTEISSNSLCFSVCSVVDFLRFTGCCRGSAGQGWEVGGEVHLFAEV